MGKRLPTLESGSSSTDPFDGRAAVSRVRSSRAGAPVRVRSTAPVVAPPRVAHDTTVAAAGTSQRTYQPSRVVLVTSARVERVKSRRVSLTSTHLTNTLAESSPLFVAAFRTIPTSATSSLRTFEPQRARVIAPGKSVPSASVTVAASGTITRPRGTDARRESNRGCSSAASHAPLRSEIAKLPVESAVALATLPPTWSAAVNAIRAPLSRVRASESKTMPRTFTRFDAGFICSAGATHADNQIPTVKMPSLANDGDEAAGRDRPAMRDNIGRESGGGGTTLSCQRHQGADSASGQSATPAAIETPATPVAFCASIRLLSMQVTTCIRGPRPH